MDFILEVSWLIIINIKINVDKLIPLCLGGFFCVCVWQCVYSLLSFSQTMYQTCTVDVGQLIK